MLFSSSNINHTSHKKSHVFSHLPPAEVHLLLIEYFKFFMIYLACIIWSIVHVLDILVLPPFLLCCKKLQKFTACRGCEQRKGCVWVQVYSPWSPAGKQIRQPDKALPKCLKGVCFVLVHLKYILEGCSQKYDVAPCITRPHSHCQWQHHVSYTVVSIFSMISIIDLDGESREQSSWSQRLPGLEFPSVLNSSSSSSSLSSSQDSR